MSNPGGQPASDGPTGDAPGSAPASTPGPGHPVSPFYLSPTWNWPEFDPECCQECGRVIPMHETGWILHEVILCEECFEILDEREQRQGREQERHEEQNAQAKATPRTVSLPVWVPPPAAPAWELTSPTSFEYRHCFATGLSDEHSQMGRTALAAATDALPLIDAMIPPFVLTPPDSSAWRARFADALPTECDAPSPAPAAATDSLPLIDAMIPRFKLTPPDASAWRAYFADAVKSREELTAAAPAVAADSLPLIDAMIPRFKLTPPDASAWRAHFADALLASHESTANPTITAPAAAADPLPLIDAMLSLAKPTPPDTTAWRARLADAPPSEAAPAAAPAPAPATVPAPIRKTKARKRRKTDNDPPAAARLPAPLAAPVARALTFQHPVDALLNELHEKTIDAQYRQHLRQSRQRDPFFAEMDAMLAAATQLRDQWMSRSEKFSANKSSTG